MKKMHVLAAVLVSAALIFAGCSSNDDDPATGGSEFNDADVAFAQQMIPHHQQAIEMAEMAQDRAENTQVKELAADIERAQGPEIEMMSGWLREWGEEVPETGQMDGMDHGDTSTEQSLHGMMSEDDMDELHQSSGIAFDEMFLTMMIEHHDGAIEMAQTEQEDGKSSDAVELATKIESDQKAEIETMQALLDS